MSRFRNPSPQQLIEEPAYRKVMDLGFEEMVPFVWTHIRQKGLFSYLYFWVNLITLAGLVIYVISLSGTSGFSWGKAAGQAILGFLSGSILVIPVHELIHGIAYRMLGARKIRFGADLEQFVFYVAADRYTVSGFQIYFLALSPFLVINVMALWITLSFFPQSLIWTGMFLLSHNIMCIGDFAVSNFVIKSPYRIYSFDEPDRKRSYFFEQKPEKN